MALLQALLCIGYWGGLITEVFLSIILVVGDYATNNGSYQQ